MRHNYRSVSGEALVGGINVGTHHFKCFGGFYLNGFEIMVNLSTFGGKGRRFRTVDLFCSVRVEVPYSLSKIATEWTERRTLHKPAKHTGPTGISEGVAYAIRAGKNYEWPGWRELGVTRVIDRRMARGRSPLKPHHSSEWGVRGAIRLFICKGQSI